MNAILPNAHTQFEPVVFSHAEKARYNDFKERNKELVRTVADVGMRISVDFKIGADYLDRDPKELIRHPILQVAVDNMLQGWRELEQTVRCYFYNDAALQEKVLAQLKNETKGLCANAAAGRMPEKPRARFVGASKLYIYH